MTRVACKTSKEVVQQTTGVLCILTRVVFPLIKSLPMKNSDPSGTVRIASKNLRVENY